jgi:hypothetical protein
MPLPTGSVMADPRFVSVAVSESESEGEPHRNPSYTLCLVH